MQKGPVLPLDSARFAHLANQASGERDFAFLGGWGQVAGPGGRFRFFSALAADSLSIHAPLADPGFGTRWAGPLEAALARHTLPPELASSGLPFVGGWIGSLAYEAGYAGEPRLHARARWPDSPLLCAHFYLWAAVQDPAQGRAWLVFHPDCPRQTREQVMAWLDAPPGRPRHGRLTTGFQPETAATDYQAAVAEIRRLIHQGDCYQANLSQAFSATFEGDGWPAWQRLSEQHPTPYSAFLRDSAGGSLWCFSPELFLEFSEGQVRTSPIKGTRGRGRTAQEDRALREALCASGKDRAENLMIVDLLRNDLGRFCRPGSVKVDRLFAVESFANVHHLVSTITGRLAEPWTAFDALLSAFPGGSITGAPKIRAMEIIRSLEPHWRGPYCGSVFHWGLNGRLCSNIAIRSLYQQQDRLWCWGGGGIVADSDPLAEYEETLTKVRPLMRGLEVLGNLRG